ncbi:MAG TPA: hypothetical protein VF290_18150 [Pyrinomonadaceae bacterium]
MANSRIEVPIPPHPEPESQPDLAFEFTEGKNGLLEFHAESTEAHIVAFQKVNEGIDDHFWSQGAIVASLTKKHGEKGEAIEKMASAVELSAGHLLHMGRTWRTFQFLARAKDLSFSHHKVACRHPNPVEALAVAKEKGWSKNQLNEWISEQALRRATKATQKAKRAARNDWREHLLHMDKVIREDFIANSPNQQFAKRVCGEWLVEIGDELKQLEFTEHRELVMNAIDERGAEDRKAIRNLTGLDYKEIDNIIACLLSENLYEWIPKGGKKDDQRGQPSMYLHRVGTPCGH